MGMPIVFIGITLSGATLCQKMERAKKIEAVSSERLEELKASYVDKGIYIHHIYTTFRICFSYHGSYAMK